MAEYIDFTETSFWKAVAFIVLQPTIWNIVSDTFRLFFINRSVI